MRIHGPVGNRCPGSHNQPSLPPQDQSCQGQAVDFPLHPVFDPSRSKAKILKRIPHTSCDPSARKLVAIIDQVVSSNIKLSWERLLHFAPRCLRVPKRGGHRRSLASHVNSMIKEEADPDPPQSVPGKSTSRVPKVPLEFLGSSSGSEAGGGGLRGAIRLASYKDTMVDINSSTLSALPEKPSLPHRDSAALPTFAEINFYPIQVSAEEVAKAICSFHCGSSCSPDGLRPQHLKVDWKFCSRRRPNVASVPSLLHQLHLIR